MAITLRIAAIACLFALTACGDNPQPSKTAKQAASAPEPKQASSKNEFAKDLPASAETIYVATDATFPPYEFRDEYGNIIGLEVDLINAIASDQGMKAIVRNEPWNNIFSKVSTPDSNSKQLVMAVVGDNEERRKTYQLSDSYLSSPNIIITKDDSPIKKPQDLNGKKVSVLENSASVDILKQAHIKPATFNSNSSTFLSFKELIAGQTDAIFDDGIVLSYHMKNYPEYKFRKISVMDNQKFNSGVVIVSNKGNTALINKINAGIANIKKNGIYNQILNKWSSDTK